MRLKFLLFNVQDFFFRLQYPISPSDMSGLSDDEFAQLGVLGEELKPLSKIRGIAQVLKIEKPDIAMFCEMGGQEALAQFSKLFLDDAYQPLSTPPISKRGIETGYLIRRDLAVKTAIYSHATETVDFLYPHEVDPEAYYVSALLAPTLALDPPGKRRLSRDIPELRLYREHEPTPFAVVLLAHLKSAYDPAGIDFEGQVQRQAEVKVLLGIRERLALELGDGVPIIIAGDLNGRACLSATGPEFRDIYRKTDLLDVLEIATVPEIDRITHVMFRGPEALVSQLDYILIPKQLHQNLVAGSAYVHRYRCLGSDAPMPWPRSSAERHEMPSDHFPVVATIDFPDANAGKPASTSAAIPV